MSNEEDGSTAPTAYGSAQAGTLIAEPTTARIVGRPFQKGQSGNAAGRPRKGETIAEKLARADAKIARKALRARDKRLELLNQVGQKTFETWLAYSVGLPAQKYIVEQSDSPLLAFLTRHTAQLPYVEGESVRLDAQDDTAKTQVPDA